MVWGLDDFVLGNLAIPSDDIFHVATRTNMSYNSSDCVLVYAFFGRCLLGCVRIHATIPGTRIIATTSVTQVRRWYAGI